MERSLESRVEFLANLEKTPCLVVSIYSQCVKIHISSLLFLIPDNMTNLRALRNEPLWV